MRTIAQQLNIKEFPFVIKDKNGKQIYWESSRGYWVNKEYDSNGNEIYSRSPGGYWVKKKYDSNGNEIYYETSKGYWVKIEYDSNGNVIYWENSYGTVADNRPKSCAGKVVEIDGKKYKLMEI